ncbi:MAG TPA: tetrahydrofolate dehydrogenase/cyclohydrolase catalytic domain-containing protein [Candidatus Bipolaricaulis anaerobius]|uniref:Bifunctional protein FolD n=1 Tax=Candidatus Bipolaricaulis anaerobius TaxID=2026885 RepID=A0A2X3L0V2_9BACT|nr:tetrahydrofolate dehydrogenase/cyclohydrolase catalytic domain-containing protein [Candidatus Bipolaricaulis anaerobius]SQD92819.1 Bifunctional protein FolD 1 [Includes: Methylenetetrahydrofolate dehydrogenase; Methenyltetrahydrofolate cyclohydrolase] [Candidatus Bipolaricaulis anaerobius]HNR24067.1 tetrahydrofolate dehydrogenase/cyclohydrolase catalytic domain-containing protein [Candidatus Bipolaricaulis anaerobius]HNS23850.1 tetrahydrofolate dehydrogenase/cyclohydrolase catalytic domain-co
MGRILSGEEIAAQIKAELRTRVADLARKGIVPGLAIVRVGEDPSSASYVRQKERAAQGLGLLSTTTVLPTRTSEDELLAVVSSLNEDPRFHGVLVQLPLPPDLSPERVCGTVAPAKDVDCLHPENIGRLVRGDPYLLPCTPHAVQQILHRSGYPPAGKHVVIVGRSALVGRPLSILLSQKGPAGDATVTLCHSATPDLGAFTHQADILVVAVGRPRLVTADMVRAGAVVIDVGVNRVDDPTAPKGYRLVGDTEYEAVGKVAAAITPVPGGVGPVTVAMLLGNTVAACEAQAQPAR